MKTCKGFRKNGDKCSSKTESPTGFCGKCRPSYDSVLINQMLFCVDSPLSEQQCPVRNKAETESPKGPVCWYELYDEIPHFKDRDQVVEAAKRILGSGYRVTLRIDRFVAAMPDYDSRLVNDFNKVRSITFTQLGEYMKMRGWTEKQAPKIDEERKKVLEAIFGKDQRVSGVALPTGDDIILIEEPDYDSEVQENFEETVNEVVDDDEIDFEDEEDEDE